MFDAILKLPPPQGNLGGDAVSARLCGQSARWEIHHRLADTELGYAHHDCPVFQELGITTLTGADGCMLLTQLRPAARMAGPQDRPVQRPGAGGGATAHTAKKRANSFAPPTTMTATKIAQYASRSNTLRHLRRACSCERRSGFISRRLGMERAYSESHPAASGWRGRPQRSALHLWLPRGNLI